MEDVKRIWYSTSQVAKMTGLKSWYVRELARKNPNQVRISKAGYFKFHYKFVDTLKKINL